MMSSEAEKLRVDRRHRDLSNALSRIAVDEQMRSRKGAEKKSEKSMRLFTATGNLERRTGRRARKMHGEGGA
jgi:hypothetical protein